MNLLVVGADRVDAGKTTFATGLIEHTGAVGFKPRAGNDLWFHHGDVRTATDSGSLFGGDARRLADVSPGQFDPEEINPIHRLWRPSPGPDQGLLGGDDREFLLDRVGEQYVRNGTVDLPAFLGESLPLAEALAVTSTDQLNRVVERHHLPALSGLAETVSRTERAVVESYGDVARPLRGVSPDAVAVVEPARVRVYRGERFERACEVTSTSPYEGQLEERVGSVVDLLDPVASVELRPLGKGDRADPSTIASVYSEAYERVVSVARE